MTTQQQAFLTRYLGAANSLIPSDAVRERMRATLLLDGWENRLDTGAQSSPRNIPGIDRTPYALLWEMVTPDEVEALCKEWVDFESLRGLGWGGPYLTPSTKVYKSTHFTLTQHALIASLSPSSGTRKVALKQMVELRGFILTDKVVTDPAWMGPSRAIGWSGQGLALDFMATGDAKARDGLITLLGKLSIGEENGVPFIWRNTNAIKDPNHVYECNVWMDATCVKALALAVSLLPGYPALQPKLVHALRCISYCQRDDGTFHDDYGWNKDGSPGFHESPGESTETFVWPALFAAKEALEDDWPAWCETMLHRCQTRYEALNRFKPQDSGFRDEKNQSIAIACAAGGWGWRQ